MTAAVCPLSVQDTDGGDGTSAQTDRVPSVELQANRYLSSWANLMAVTAANKEEQKAGVKTDSLFCFFNQHM